ncbi:MAG: LPS export ABC transporter periplasmic protein LptC [Bacteroidales bacterium]|nr:LPS export ABC transporter periplasmic protein LptC [Bacteroidales bacterium]
MFRKSPNIKNISLVAIAYVIATIVVSCGNKTVVGEIVDVNAIPRQTVNDMYAVQTNNGILQMRMEAKLMQRFQNDSTKISYELFPEGFDVYAYNNEGLLETHIHSEVAKHTTTKNDEKWEAYGNVVIKNFIKGERMETDTLYWDRETKRIFTHRLVKMFSPQGFMQGYGMHSDEMARNAQILKPFDSYGIINDSTSTKYIDSVNFIGPVQKREQVRNKLLITEKE